MNANDIRKSVEGSDDRKDTWKYAWEYTGLLMIIAAGAALRLVSLGYQSMWYDELYNARVRKMPLVDMVPEIISAGHPPAFIFMGHFWSWMGSGEIAVRSLSAIIGVATIALVYLTGRELFSRGAGLWAAALAAFSPFLVWYSRDATSYSWVIFISLLSFYFLARSSIRGGWRNWTSYVLITGLAALSHFYMVMFILACLPVFWFLRRKESNIRPWFFSQTAIFAVLILIMGIGRAIAGNRTDIKVPDSMPVIKGIIAAPILYLQGYNGAFSSPGATITFSNKYWLLALALVLIAGAAITITQVMKWHFLSREAAAVASALLIYIFTIALLHNMLGGFNSGRYYAMGAPLLLLLMAAFIAAIPRRAGVLVGLTILAAALFFTGWELKEPHNDDWRSVMAVISNQRTPGDRILCFPIHHCIAAAEFYLDQPILIKGGFIMTDSKSSVLMKVPESGWAGYRTDQEYTSYEEFSGDGLERKLDAELAGGERVWLIAGDGTKGYYPSAGNIAVAIGNEWVKKGEWRFPPLVLGLYQRASGNQAG